MQSASQRRLLWGPLAVALLASILKASYLSLYSFSSLWKAAFAMLLLGDLPTLSLLMLLLGLAMLANLRPLRWLLEASAILLSLDLGSRSG